VAGRVARLNGLGRAFCAKPEKPSGSEGDGATYGISPGIPASRFLSAFPSRAARSAAEIAEIAEIADTRPRLRARLTRRDAPVSGGRRKRAAPRRRTANGER